LVRNDALVDQLIEDYTQADLSPADQSMLDYAVQLTQVPGSTGRDGVEALRGAGFDDRAILDIVQIVAYFAFANRLACGLGVALEDSGEGA
jgi:uncharacterized peroxidase-related enzyme